MIIIERNVEIYGFAIKYLVYDARHYDCFNISVQFFLQIGPDFKAKENGTWAPDYHGLLYNLTDDAIQVCPPNTTWLVVTNGDNEYADSFMARVIEESSNKTNGDKDVGSAPPDIVAFDFYSRFQRITMPACERFAARPPPAPLCKSNSLQWCKFDLGAAALNWQRFKSEKRSFGGVLSEDEQGRELDADSSDGLLMEVLARDGWKAVHVTDKCLFAHNPSIQACAWKGGVWDDRDVILESGGMCITPSQADQILKKDSQTEQVLVHVSSDGHVDAFENAKQSSLKAVRCLRHKNYKEESIWGLTQVWYSKWCTDDDDLELYENQLRKFYPTEESLEAAIDAAQAHADALAQGKSDANPKLESSHEANSNSERNDASGGDSTSDILSNTYISDDSYEDYDTA